MTFTCVTVTLEHVGGNGVFLWSWLSQPGYRSLNGEAESRQMNWQSSIQSLTGYKNHRGVIPRAPFVAGAEATLSRNALLVLEARYLQRDEHQLVIETPFELFMRVANAVASAECLVDYSGKFSYWRDEFYRMLASLEFLPNSPTLMNAGTPLGQLSACFVLPVPDNLEGIFDALKQMAIIERGGGGIGFAFSSLRPKGDFVSSTGGDSSGPVSFMKIFDCATENIKQGGRRRGANMGVLGVDHPDIIEFINAKQDGRTLQNFNLAVGVTDRFMQAVREDERVALKHPSSGRIVETLPARDIFDAIVEASWSSGDPGLLFLDAINRTNPTLLLGAIEATNPCGEVPLLPYEACNLGSVNLSRMLQERAGKTEVDWDKLASTIHKAVRFLDNVIEINKYPTAEIDRASRGNRKIGLGVMGFAETLIRLGISYDSTEAIFFAERLMNFIADEALIASQGLAEERGVFPNWRGSVYEAEGLRVRNATRTAIAPTGTIGIIANTTSGIEPLFALAYRRRNVLNGRTLLEINPLFADYLQPRGWDTEELTQQILENGNLTSVSAVPEELRALFVTALEISAEHHLQIQAAFQRHTDNSVSKTINLPCEISREEIAHAYQRAWELGLKGITVYRYGSKASQVFELGMEDKPLQYDHTSRCDPQECRL